MLSLWQQRQPVQVQLKQGMRVRGACAVRACAWCTVRTDALLSHLRSHACMHTHTRARSCKEMVSYWWGRAGTRYKCIPARSGWSKLSLVRHDEAEKHSTDMDARTHPAHLHDVRAVDVKRCRDHAEAQISRHDTRVSVICSTCPSVWRCQLKQEMNDCEHRWFTIRW